MKMSALNKIFGGFSVLAIFASLNASQNIRDSFDEVPIIFFVLIIALILLTLFALIRYSIVQTKCPNCGEVMQREFVGKEVLSEKKGYKTVIREARDDEGNIVSQWEDQICTKTVEYLNRYQCANCGHEWTVKSVQEYDSFED